jgi:REP element-mobilizing transposase RayT
MPRKPRQEVPGGLFHITARGVRRDVICFDRHDFAAFEAIIGRAVVRFGWTCLAYCLMPTHLHLAVVTPQTNRGHGMRHIIGSYAQRVNRRYDRSGHVFQGPYYAGLVEREPHSLELCRYVSANPRRARLVRRPEEWPWSSYRALLGLVPAPDFLAVDEALAQYGPDLRRARRRFRSFVEDVSLDRVPGQGPPVTRM